MPAQYPPTPKLPISIFATCTSNSRTAQKQFDHLFPLKKIPKNWNRSFQVKSLRAHGSGRRAPLPPQLFSLFPCKPLAFSLSALFSPQVAFPQYKEPSVLLRRPSFLGAPHITRCFFLKKTSDKADTLSLELPPIYSQIAAARSSFHRNATTLTLARSPPHRQGPTHSASHPCTRAPPPSRGPRAAAENRKISPASARSNPAAQRRAARSDLAGARAVFGSSRPFVGPSPRREGSPWETLSPGVKRRFC